MIVSFCSTPSDIIPDAAWHTIIGCLDVKTYGQLICANKNHRNIMKEVVRDECNRIEEGEKIDLSTASIATYTHKRYTLHTSSTYRLGHSFRNSALGELNNLTAEKFQNALSLESEREVPIEVCGNIVDAISSKDFERTLFPFHHNDNSAFLGILKEENHIAITFYAEWKNTITEDDLVFISKDRSEICWPSNLMERYPAIRDYVREKVGKTLDKHQMWMFQ